MRVNSLSLIKQKKKQTRITFFLATNENGRAFPLAITLSPFSSLGLLFVSNYEFMRNIIEGGKDYEDDD